MAGRVARAFIVETPGVYQPSWTIEEVGERLAAIREPGRPLDAARRPLRPYRTNPQEFRDDKRRAMGMAVKVYERILQLFEAEGINTIFGIADPNFVHLFRPRRGTRLAGRLRRITRSRPGSWPRRCPG